MTTIYIVTDCEFDGPTPGDNSLLAFGSVALTAGGQFIGEFQATLAPLPGATTDPANMAFWENNPGAWASATSGQEPPDDVMMSFVSWVRSLDGEAVFAAHPLEVDAPWIDHYLRRFGAQRLCDGPWVEGRLFRDLPICIRSYAAGRLGWPFERCSVRNYPADWLGGHVHTHRAIDDARGYASLLRYLLLQYSPASVQ
jgi:hypothetical protein